MLMSGILNYINGGGLVGFGMLYLFAEWKTRNRRRRRDNIQQQGVNYSTLIHWVHGESDTNLIEFELRVNRMWWLTITRRWSTSFTYIRYKLGSQAAFRSRTIWPESLQFSPSDKLSLGLAPTILKDSLHSPWWSLIFQIIALIYDRYRFSRWQMYRASSAVATYKVHVLHNYKF